MTRRTMLIALVIVVCFTTVIGGRARADIVQCTPKIGWDGSLGFECVSLMEGPATDGQNYDSPPPGFRLPHAYGNPPALYRVFNWSSGDHLYSIDYDETNSALWSYGYGAYEGIVGRCWGSQVGGTTPLFRLVNGSHHFYTTDWNEMQSVQGSGFAYEGVACYVYTQPQSGTCPFYRVNLGSNHFYTASWSEVAQAQNMAGGTYEGVTGYINYDGACPN